MDCAAVHMNIISIDAPPYTLAYTYSCMFPSLAKYSTTWTELNTLFGWNSNQMRGAPLELDAMI